VGSGHQRAIRQSAIVDGRWPQSGRPARPTILRHILNFRSFSNILFVVFTGSEDDTRVFVCVVSLIW
jgi:hypothetical protein